MIASVGIRNSVRGVSRKSTALRCLNIDHPQDRAEHETHEQIDPGPQEAAENMHEIQPPEAVTRDHDNHDRERERNIPKVMPADQASAVDLKFLPLCGEFV